MHREPWIPSTPPNRGIAYAVGHLIAIAILIALAALLLAFAVFVIVTAARWAGA